MPTPIKVGIIGYGSSVRYFHMPYLLPNPDLEIYAFLQRAEAPKDPATAEPWTHCTVDFPKAKHHRMSETFFSDPEIELVIVCTQQASHAEFAEKALRAEKHGEYPPKSKSGIIINMEQVIVEKPFTTTTEEADRVIAVAKETGKILTTFQSEEGDQDPEILSISRAVDALYC